VKTADFRKTTLSQSSRPNQFTIAHLKIILALVTSAVLLAGCARRQRPHQHHHFVSLGVKDLPLILFDQASSKVCFAGNSPMPPAYLSWMQENVNAQGSKDFPYYRVDVMFHDSDEK
jgi:hypothetical protein